MDAVLQACAVADEVGALGGEVAELLGGGIRDPDAGQEAGAEEVDQDGGVDSVGLDAGLGDGAGLEGVGRDDLGDARLKQADDGPGVGGGLESQHGGRAELLPGEVFQRRAGGGETAAVQDRAGVVDDNGFDDFLVEIEGCEWHTGVTLIEESGPGDPGARNQAHRVNRRPVVAHRGRANGQNGTYLFELGAQPGGPEGRPHTTAGSKPIAVTGRPRGVRPRSPRLVRMSSHLVPYPVSLSRTPNARARQAVEESVAMRQRRGPWGNHARYDADGRRVKATVDGATTYFIYDVQGQMVAEYTMGSPASDGLQYVAVDALGSTRVVEDGSGTVTARRDYSPYGEELATSNRTTALKYGSSFPRVQFTGKERDSETGLDYFGARYFSSAQGRFTSPDWSAVPQPVPYADLTDPQTLNLYSYVRNNPLRRADPDGHCGLDWNCWSQFGSGVADTTYRPIVQAVSHPIDTLGALGSAAMDPIDAAVAVNVVQGAEVGEASTALFRAVGSAEAESIGAKSAFTAAPNGTEFKGFFFNQSDAQSFRTRMTQMTGDTHTVVQGEAPTSLINASPPHTAATEGPGVLIRNQNLPQVKVKLPDQP